MHIDLSVSTAESDTAGAAAWLFRESTAAQPLLRDLVLVIKTWAKARARPPPYRCPSRHCIRSGFCGYLLDADAKRCDSSPLLLGEFTQRLHRFGRRRAASTTRAAARSTPTPTASSRSTTSRSVLCALHTLHPTRPFCALYTRPSGRAPPEPPPAPPLAAAGGAAAIVRAVVDARGRVGARGHARGAAARRTGCGYVCLLRARAQPRHPGSPHPPPGLN